MQPEQSSKQRRRRPPRRPAGRAADSSSPSPRSQCAAPDIEGFESPPSHREEVELISPELQDPLDRIESSRWRAGGQVEGSSVINLTCTKLAEVIVASFRQVLAIRFLVDPTRRRGIVASLERRIRRLRRAASNFPEKDDLDRLHLLICAAAASNQLREIKMGCYYEALHDMKSSIPRELDKLLLFLLGVLVHTTRLTTNHILHRDGVASGLLALAFRFHPDIARGRGISDPLDRFKKRILADRDAQQLCDNDYSLLRRYLFNRDPRFPAMLFRPRQPIRTPRSRQPIALE